MATTPILATPFGTEPFDEIPLTRAPLVQTLTQVRFPTQSALLFEDEIAKAIARTLRPDYPVFGDQKQVQFIIGPDGASQSAEGPTVWRLASSDETWQLSFTADFLTLATTRYTNRDEFCSRLGSAWELFSHIVGEPRAQRIGFRYINRVAERSFLDHLPEMIRSELMGATFAGGEDAPIVRSVTENNYLRPDGGMLARWGILPPGDTYDPFTLPAHATTSWVLDLDAYVEFATPTAVSSEVPTIVKSLSKDAYRYFRWAVSEQFLSYFGGEV